MRNIDINCDMGEGIGNDELLMPYISSANIACGFHAGSIEEMKRVVALCLEHHVAIGAHPSFPDKENFGRKVMILPGDQVEQLIREQLSILNEIVITAGGTLHHVKLHGALYNMAAKDHLLSKTVAATVKEFDETLVYYGLSGSLMVVAAADAGMRTAQEVFADRTYQPDGSLTPRTSPGAMITDVDQAILQAIQMVNQNQVIVQNGEKLSIQADTICLHGDGQDPVGFAKGIHQAFTKAGIQIQTI